MVRSPRPYHVYQVETNRNAASASHKILMVFPELNSIFVSRFWARFENLHHFYVCQKLVRYLTCKGRRETIGEMKGEVLENSRSVLNVFTICSINCEGENLTLRKHFVGSQWGHQLRAIKSITLRARRYWRKEEFKKGTEIDSSSLPRRPRRANKYKLNNKNKPHSESNQKVNNLYNA